MECAVELLDALLALGHTEQKLLPHHAIYICELNNKD